MAYLWLLCVQVQENSVRFVMKIQKGLKEILFAARCTKKRANQFECVARTGLEKQGGHEACEIEYSGTSSQRLP